MRAARAEWTRRRQPLMRGEPHRLVLVDERRTKTNMTRLRGRARHGTRARDDTPLRHKGTQTFVAGLRHDQLVAPWLLDGPINRAALTFGHFYFREAVRIAAAMALRMTARPVA